MAKKRVSEEDKQALAALVIDEIEKHERGEIERLSTNAELGDLLGVCGRNIPIYLQDLCSKEIRDYRVHVIQSYTMKKNHSNPQFATSHSERTSKRIKILNADLEFRAKRNKAVELLVSDPEFIQKQRARSRNYRASPSIKEKYAVINNSELSIARFKKRMEHTRSDPRWIAKQREVGRNVMKELHKNPLFIARRLERAIRNLKRCIKNLYLVEGRFYASSQQEGAAALLLEKYVQNYCIGEGETFQVRDKGINNGGIDFLVENEFLEWHPIILANGVRTRGDISSAEEVRSYKKVLESLPEDEQKDVKEAYKRVLAVNYRNSRQEAVDNSDYSGANVVLATDIRELYDFLSDHNAEIPSFDDFKREFNQKVRHVKGFKVKKEKPAEAVEVISACAAG